MISFISEENVNCTFSKYYTESHMIYYIVCLYTTVHLTERNQLKLEKIEF